VIVRIAHGAFLDIEDLREYVLQLAAMPEIKSELSAQLSNLVTHGYVSPWRTLSGLGSVSRLYRRFCRSVVDRSKAVQQLHIHGEQFHVPFFNAERASKVASALLPLKDDSQALTIQLFFGSVLEVLENPDSGVPQYNVAASMSSE